MARGFSIKELTLENQKERSLVDERLIVGHVRTAGGITKVEITKELAARVRQKDLDYMDENTCVT